MPSSMYVVQAVQRSGVVKSEILPCAFPSVVFPASHHPACFKPRATDSTRAGILLAHETNYNEYSTFSLAHWTLQLTLLSPSFDQGREGVEALLLWSAKSAKKGPSYPSPTSRIFEEILEST